MPTDRDTHITRNNPDSSLRLMDYLIPSLYSKMHFLALPLGSLTLQDREDVRLIGTDGRRLVWNGRELLAVFSADEEAALLLILHELLHCLLGHPFTAGVDPDRWNLACDLTAWRLADEIYPVEKKSPTSSPVSKALTVIHHSVFTAEPDAGPEGNVSPLSWEDVCSHLPASDRVTAPLVYQQLGEDQWLSSHIEELRHLCRADDHRLWVSDLQSIGRPGASGEQTFTDQSAKEPSAAGQAAGEQACREQSVGGQAPDLARRWQTMRRQINRELHRARRTRGTSFASIHTLLQLTGEQRYSYRDFLRRFASMRENNQVNPDEFSYADYAYGLTHYGNIPLIEPLEYTEEVKLAELAIVIDTSGSCSGELVRMFLEETRGILLKENLFFSRFHLEIIQCDNRVQAIQRITSNQDFEAYIRSLTVIGGGGTDYRPAFTCINELVADGSFSRLKGILYFTDGCGIYPSEMPPYETAFIFLESRYDDIDVPDWALKLVLPL